MEAPKKSIPENSGGGILRFNTVIFSELRALFEIVFRSNGTDGTNKTNGKKRVVEKT